MDHYSYGELADMHLIYGRTYGNSRAAQRLYQETFPQRRCPSRKMFTNVDRHLRETGSFSPVTHDIGLPRTSRTHDAEEQVLSIVMEAPETSTRQIAAVTRISQPTVWRILHEANLYPYHIQRVQGLAEADFQPRLTFCQWFLQRCAGPNFAANVLFTDESGFTRDAILNFHNTHQWAEENPHSLRQSRHQQQFSLNVWAAIIADHLIGPYFLPPRLNGLSYTQFLEEELGPLLEDVPLEVRRQMFFMHDGAPAHFSRIARTFLNAHYPNRWIGRMGPIAWPARSPDLNPLDFFLWGYLKMQVYATPVSNIQVLRDRILEGCEQIRNIPGIFENVRQSMRRRCMACIAAQGGHFEHLL